MTTANDIDTYALRIVDPVHFSLIQGTVYPTSSTSGEVGMSLYTNPDIAPMHPVDTKSTSSPLDAMDTAFNLKSALIEVAEASAELFSPPQPLIASSVALDGPTAQEVSLLKEPDTPLVLAGEYLTILTFVAQNEQTMRQGALRLRI